MLWFDHLISFLKISKEEVESEDPIVRCHATDLSQLPLSFPTSIQHLQSNSYLWNFMRHSSKKHSSKPFVVFKTWDTNDRGVDAKQIFKIGKVTAWDSENRVTILLYSVVNNQNLEWAPVLPSNSSIR